MKNVLVTFVTVLMVLAISLKQSTASQVAEPWVYSFSLGASSLQRSFKMPSALYIDSQLKRYYVVDSMNNQLHSFDKDGKLLSSFNANKSLSAPFDLEKDSNGNLLVLEKGKNAVTRINLKNKEIKEFELVDNGEAIFPHRLEKFGGLLFILSGIKKNIYSVNLNSMKIKAKNSCTACNGYVDFKIINDSIWSLSDGGDQIEILSEQLKTERKIFLKKRVDSAISFDVDSNGKIYILDRHSCSVKVFDPMGNFLYSLFGKGQSIGKLYFPIELRFDPWGRLCIVSEGNGRVDVFSR